MCQKLFNESERRFHVQVVIFVSRSRSLAIHFPSSFRKKFPTKYKERSDRFEITGVTKREPRPSRRAFSGTRHRRTRHTKRPNARTHSPFHPVNIGEIYACFPLWKPLSISHLACRSPPPSPAEARKIPVRRSTYASRTKYRSVSSRSRDSTRNRREGYRK